MVNADRPHVIHRANKGANTMDVKHNASYQSGENVAEKSSGRLADALVRNLNGEFDEIGMELSLEFRKVESSEDGEITIHAIEIDD